MNLSYDQVIPVLKAVIDGRLKVVYWSWIKRTGTTRYIEADFEGGGDARKRYFFSFALGPLDALVKVLSMKTPKGQTYTSTVDSELLELDLARSLDPLLPRVDKETKPKKKK